jgi:hypothetical protein
MLTSSLVHLEQVETPILLQRGRILIDTIFNVRACNAVRTHRIASEGEYQPSRQEMIDILSESLAIVTGTSLDASGEILASGPDVLTAAVAQQSLTHVTPPQSTSLPTGGAAQSTGLPSIAGLDPASLPFEATLPPNPALDVSLPAHMQQPGAEVRIRLSQIHIMYPMIQAWAHAMAASPEVRLSDPMLQVTITPTSSFQPTVEAPMAMDAAMADPPPSEGAPMDPSWLYNGAESAPFNLDPTRPALVTQATVAPQDTLRIPEGLSQALSSTPEPEHSRADLTGFEMCPKCPDCLDECCSCAAN